MLPRDGSTFFYHCSPALLGQNLTSHQHTDTPTHPPHPHAQPPTNPNAHAQLTFFICRHALSQRVVLQIHNCNIRACLDGILHHPHVIQEENKAVRLFPAGQLFSLCLNPNHLKGGLHCYSLCVLPRKTEGTPQFQGDVVKNEYLSNTRHITPYHRTTCTWHQHGTLKGLTLLEWGHSL